MSYIVIDNPLFEDSSSSQINGNQSILLEADGDNKYSLDDSTGDSPADDKTNNDNTDEQDDDTKYSLDDGTGEDASNDTNPDNPDDNTDDTSASGDTEDDSTDSSTDDDATSEDNSTPSGEAKILNLSEKDKQLNNLKLIRKFSKLENDLQLTVNNLASKITYSPKQVQVIDLCLENLNDMIEDVKNYITIKFSDTYETNVTAYLTFLKRFKTILALVRVSDDLK